MSKLRVVRNMQTMHPVTLVNNRPKAPPEGDVSGAILHYFDAEPPFPGAEVTYVTWLPGRAILDWRGEVEIDVEEVLDT